MAEPNRIWISKDDMDKGYFSTMPQGDTFVEYTRATAAAPSLTCAKCGHRCRNTKTGVCGIRDCECVCDFTAPAADQPVDLDPLEFWCDLAEVLGHPRPTKVHPASLVAEVNERITVAPTTEARDDFKDTEDWLHFKICEAVALMNQGETRPAHDVLRQALCDYPAVQRAAALSSTPSDAAVRDAEKERDA